MTRHTGNIQPALDLEEHTHPFGDSAFGCKMVVQPIPAGFISQKLIDYDVRTDSNPVYVGFNIRGIATTVETWVIQKITYDVDDRPTVIKIAVGAWDDRTSL